jgi:hypothetical protein
MDLDINPMGSVYQVFDPIQVHRLIDAAWDPLWEGDIVYDRETGEPQTLVPQPGGPLKLWVHPVMDSAGRWRLPRARYVGGSDIAMGTGATPSCLTFGRLTTGEVVAEYADPHIFPTRFAVKAVALCRLFCDTDGVGAFLAWEVQGPGRTFGKVVTTEMRYRNIYYARDDDKVAPHESDSPGWYPSPDAMRGLIEYYMADLYSGKVTNPSAVSLRETLALKYDGRGKMVNTASLAEDDPSGARENHADRVVSAGLFAKMVRERGGGRGEKTAEVDEPVTVLSRAGREALYERAPGLAEVWG